MRYVKILFLVIVAVAAVILAIANRGPVTLRLWPEAMTMPEPIASWPHEVTLPIYVALLAAVFLGLLIGMVLELLRETDHRRQERRYKAEAAKLKQENQRLAKKAGEDEDDILGLGRT